MFFRLILNLSLTAFLSVGFAANKVIVILGDSLTEGYGLEKEKAFPTLTQHILKSENNIDVQIINAGVSGSTSASAVSRAKWFLQKKPDVLILALGANDGLRGVEIGSIKKNLKDAIHLAKQNGIRVWLAGMQLPPNYGKEYTRKFAQMYKDIAKEENIPLFPFLLEGVAGQPRLNQTDGIHPNEEGQKVIARTIAVFIKKNL